MGIEGRPFETVAAFIDARSPSAVRGLHRRWRVGGRAAYLYVLDRLDCSWSWPVLFSADTWTPRNRLARDLVGISRVLVALGLG